MDPNESLEKALDPHPTPEVSLAGDHSACPLCAPPCGETDNQTGDQTADDTCLPSEPRGDHSECPRCAPERRTVPDQTLPAVLTSAQRAELESWQHNPAVNPKTGHAIKEGGPTHAKLAKEYDALRRSADAAEVEKNNQKKRAEASSRDACVCELISRAYDRSVCACEGISRRAHMDSLWAGACSVRGEEICCRECDGKCRLAVKRSECPGCQRLAAFAPQGSTARCRCQTVWTVGCERCQWQYSKPFAGFTSSCAELRAYIRAAGSALQ